MVITHHNSKLIAYVNSGIAPGSEHLLVGAPYRRIAVGRNQPP
jgi:hypothetical protein